MVSMPSGTSFARRWWLRAVLLGWTAIALAALLTSAGRVDRPFPGFLVAANLYLGATDLVSVQADRPSVEWRRRFIALLQGTEAKERGAARSA